MEKSFVYQVANVGLFLTLALGSQKSIASSQNQIKLPSNPDSKINNKSILGVDSNNNNVRDDVEIFIFNDLGKKEPQVFRAYMMFAETVTLTLMKNKDEKMLSKLHDQHDFDQKCIEALDSNSISDVLTVIKKILDTDLRKSAMNIAGTNTKKHSSPNVPKDKWKTLCR